jgi:hypothetical protein
MSSIEVEEAVTKLRSLSEERAIKVLSLIEDLAELEALENAEDLKDARAALAEMQGKTAVSGGAEFANLGHGEVAAEGRPTIPYEQLRRELGLDR